MEEIKSYSSFEDFKSRLGFVDIETTGLNYNHHDITIVGIHDICDLPRIYIKGIDLDKAKTDIEKHSHVVSFNGNRFDIPFLEKKLLLERNFVSIDLMYLLWDLGYKGGLKAIETQLGITRDNAVQGMVGKDALVLWDNYINGDKESLNKLIKYNREDIINLEVLLNFCYYKANKYPVDSKHINLWRSSILDKSFLRT